METSSEKKERIKQQLKKSLSIIKKKELAFNSKIQQKPDVTKPIDVIDWMQDILSMYKK